MPWIQTAVKIFLTVSSNTFCAKKRRKKSTQRKANKWGLQETEKIREVMMLAESYSSNFV